MRAIASPIPLEPPVTIAARSAIDSPPPRLAFSGAVSNQARATRAAILDLSERSVTSSRVGRRAAHDPGRAALGPRVRVRGHRGDDAVRPRDQLGAAGAGHARPG